MAKPREESIRTFVCIEVPASIKERIDALQRELRRIDAQVSWAKSPNIHLTLKFLGDIAASRMERVRDAVERAAAEIDPFDIEVGGAGCFPSAHNPRVVWVGLTQVPEPLATFNARLEDELAGEGIARESKRFSPHLTIGRVRTPRNARRLAETLIASGFEAESFRATEVIVMRSELNPQGAVYSPQAVIAFPSPSGHNRALS
ncbi:MAG TPA: RNA 2',3'-cyclic phosphodiesterase [Blastocatellia bacterium]|nr:RNA 2',3'-cyclic phosphodiesterase [Blastocatellia bacterium]